MNDAYIRDYRVNNITNSPGSFAKSSLMHYRSIIKKTQTIQQ